jgi:hypothetical protein
LPVFSALDTKAGFRAAMAHDVFISHSTRDKPVSDAVCAALESAGIRCWVAPRDVQPGRSFAGEITRAIQQSKAMVLIFSANSNNSSQVLREVQLAVDSQLHILQFRIEEVLLNDDLKYFLSTPHWLDALTPPLEEHLDRLATSITTLFGKPEADAPRTAAETNSANIQTRKGKKSASTPAAVISPRRFAGRWWLIGMIGAALLLAVLVWGVVSFRQNHTATKSPSPASDVSAKPPASSAAFQRSWDFAAGMPHDVRTEAVQVVDGKTWGKAGGKHFRFLTGGKSWLEATFDVPDTAAAPTRLTVWHLSSSPDGTKLGFSPVRITLNGNEIFRGSPPEISWTEQQIGLGGYVQPGRNTLLWEYLDGAQTHYWLKSFRISGGDQ